MAELVLHDVDPNLLQRLTDLASRSGRSIEQEAKLMLEEESHGRTFSDSADLIREDRDR